MEELNNLNSHGENNPEQEPKLDSMIVVVKPDAQDKLQEIISRFEKEGLKIERQITTILEPTFVNGIMYQYPHPNEEKGETIEDPKFVKNRGAQFESAKHFLQGPSTVILLRGSEDIINKVTEITGLNREPGKCSEDSIRYMFGEHEGHLMAGLDDVYYRNAIHRGKDEGEVKADKEKFGKLLNINFFE